MSSKIPSTAAMAVVLFSSLVVGIGRMWLLSQSSNEKNISSDDRNGHYLEILPLIGHATAPESYTFDAHGGGPYTGVSDGRILKWDQHQHRWIQFAITSPNRDGCEGPHNHNEKEHICGRPMGMRFDESTGDLYLADAYMGLLKVGPQGGLASKVATTAEDIPFNFTNNMDIDQSTGTVYFTDSSSQFQRRNYIASLITYDKTGRLIKYEPKSNQVTVLLRNLSIPNGVAISKDGNYLLLAESAKCRILKYWLKTEKAGSVEVFAQLQGFVDNIKTSPRGGFWVAMISQKGKLSEWLLSTPSIGNTLLNLPFDATKIHRNIMKVYTSVSRYAGNYGIAVRLSEDGDIVETFTNRMGSLSEIYERDGYLWIGNVNKPFVSRYKLQASTA